MNREIIQLGHPLLHQGAEEIIDLNSPIINELITELKTVAQRANGVGIAAPQLGVSERVFIISSKPNSRYPNAPTMTPTAMINPQLLSHNNQQEKGWEGCLSVPNLRGFVPRYTQIKVSYFDELGVKHQRELSGFIARIFQHELDHLNGLTFVDRITSNKDLISEKEWLRQYSN